MDILFRDAWLLPQEPQYCGDRWGSGQQNHALRHLGILPSEPMIDNENV